SREPYVAHYEMHDVHGIANVEKKVPLDWITEDGTYVTDEFINYVKPLVIGMIEPHFAAGLPKHLKIK
ncbi:MAG: 6-phosphofructokinase, partial [Clostridia bacterium]|nr:6-phosphofructokinase [Clostridia bacterium]